MERLQTPHLTPQQSDYPKQHSTPLHFRTQDVNLPPSLLIQRTGLTARSTIGAQRPHNDCRRFFCVCTSVLWRLYVGDLRVCRVPIVPVRQPAHSCHPKSFDGVLWQLLTNRSLTRCTRSIRSTITSLLTPPFCPPLIASRHGSLPVTYSPPAPAPGLAQGLRYEVITSAADGWRGYVRHVQCSE